MTPSIKEYKYTLEYDLCQISNTKGQKLLTLYGNCRAYGRPVVHPRCRRSGKVHTTMRTLRRVIRTAEGKCLPTGIMEAVICVKRHPVLDIISVPGANQVAIGFLAVNVPGAGRRSIAIYLVGAAGNCCIVDLLVVAARPHVLLAQVY